MKKIVLLLGAIGLSTSLYAGDKPEKAYTQTCPKIYELAKVVMTSRQMGMPINEAIKPIADSGDEDVDRFNRELVAKAYKVDVQKNRADKDEVIEDFANDAAIKCLESK